MMLWGYVTALAVLVGAALNAEADRMWPTEATERARREAELKMEERRVRARERRNRATERRLRLPLRRESRPTEEIAVLRDVADDDSRRSELPQAQQRAEQREPQRERAEPPVRPTRPIQRPEQPAKSPGPGGNDGETPAGTAPGPGYRQRQWPHQWH